MLVERSIPRIFVEGVVGAVGGAILGTVLTDPGAAVAHWVTIGALAAPTALLLTPLRGSVSYRATRYGLALSVLVMLLISFLMGREGVFLTDLLALGALVLGVGAAGHGVMILALERGRGDPRGVSG